MVSFALAVVASLPFAEMHYEVVASLEWVSGASFFLAWEQVIPFVPSFAFYENQWACH